MTEAKDTRNQEEEGWAYKYPSEEARLIREHFKVIPGYNLEKVLRGQIIERIIGDDANKFTTAALAFSMPTPDASLADPNRQVLLRRMRWELDQPLTPVRVKELIEDISKKIAVSEWKTEGDVSKAHGIWEKGVRRPILQMLDSNEDGIKDAREEYRKFFDEVSARGLPH